MTTITERGTDSLTAWQMPLIHRIFRREFRSLQRVVPDRTRTTAAGTGAVRRQARGPVSPRLPSGLQRRSS